MKRGHRAPMNGISRRVLLSAAATTGVVFVYDRLLRRTTAADSIAPLKYLTPAIDAKFGSKIVKVSNPGQEIPGLGLTWDKVAIHHYSIDQAWNADQSLLSRGGSVGFLDWWFRSSGLQHPQRHAGADCDIGEVEGRPEAGVEHVDD